MILLIIASFKVLISGDKEITKVEVVKGKEYVQIVEETDQIRIYLESQRKIYKNFKGEIFYLQPSKENREIILKLPYYKNVHIYNLRGDTVEAKRIYADTLTVNASIFSFFKIYESNFNLCKFEGLFNFLVIENVKGNIKILPDKNGFCGYGEIVIKKTQGEIDINYSNPKIFLSNTIGKIKGNINVDSLLIIGGEGDVELKLDNPFAFIEHKERKGKINIIKRKYEKIF